MSKTRNKALVEDDRWKRKGGAHKPRQSEPQVCPDCLGKGYLPDGIPDDVWIGREYCNKCEGTGEIWE